jgi:ATP-dependent DNA helicase RecQ
LAEFSEQKDDHSEVSDTLTESLNLFRLGYTAEQIANHRQLSEDTVYNHLAKVLEAGLINLDEVLTLSPAEIAEIEGVLLELPEAQRNALKPVYEQLGGVYSYGVLRCVRAAFQRKLG